MGQLIEAPVDERRDVRQQPAAEGEGGQEGGGGVRLVMLGEQYLVAGHAEPRTSWTADDLQRLLADGYENLRPCLPAGS